MVVGLVSVVTLVAIGVADAAAARCFQTSATVVGTEGADTSSAPPVLTSSRDSAETTLLPACATMT